MSGERKDSGSRERSGRDPIAADRRRARKARKLPPDAACAFCGITTPEVLLAVGRSLLDGDHVSGEANDPDLVISLCKNDHAIRSAHQHDEGVDLAHDDGRSVLARQAAALQSEAAFHRDYADAQERRATQLLELEKAFDRKDPNWRDLPEAKP
jgi:hypothetical protein